VAVAHNKQMQRARTDHKCVLGYAHRRVADLRRYALRRMRRVFLASCVGIAVSTACAEAQTLTAPLEDHGSIAVTQLPGSVPPQAQVACKWFSGQGWKRVSASSSIVAAATPFLTDDAEGRAVAYFTNGERDLLVCVDGGDRGCGDRTIIYRAIDGKWVRDKLEEIVVC
jgi:hypothetical protein